jgi:hypothetical protein
MQFRNKVIALSSAAGALAVLILMGWIFSPENNQKRAARGNIVSARALDKAASVSISADGMALELLKQGGSWVFKKDGLDYPVPADRIASFFKALSGVSELYLASSKKESWKGFGLEEGKKTLLIKDQAGKAVADLSIGNADPLGKQVYLALAGKDSVYLAANDFLSYIRADQRSWSDLRVFPASLKETDVQEMIIKADLPGDGKEDKGLKFEYRLARDAKKGWKVVGNEAFKLDIAAADKLARSMAGLQGDSFVTDKLEDAQALFKNVQASVMIRNGKGEQLTAQFSAPDAEQRHMLKTDGGKLLFAYSAWNLKNALKPLDELAYVEPAKKK